MITPVNNVKMKVKLNFTWFYVSVLKLSNWFTFYMDGVQNARNPS